MYCRFQYRQMARQMAHSAVLSVRCLFPGRFHSILHSSLLPTPIYAKPSNKFLAMHLPRHLLSLHVPASPPDPAAAATSTSACATTSLPPCRTTYALQPPQVTQHPTRRSHVPLSAHIRTAHAYCMTVQTRPRTDMHSPLRRCRCLRVACGMPDWERRGFVCCVTVSRRHVGEIGESGRGGCW